MSVYNIRLTAILDHFKQDNDYLRARRELVRLETDVLKHIKREDLSDDGDSSDLHILHSSVDQMIDATYKYEAFNHSPSRGSLQTLVSGSY